MAVTRDLSLWNSFIKKRQHVSHVSRSYHSSTLPRPSPLATSKNAQRQHVWQLLSPRGWIISTVYPRHTDRAPLTTVTTCLRAELQAWVSDRRSLEQRLVETHSTSRRRTASLPRRRALWLILSPLREVSEQTSRPHPTLAWWPWKCWWTQTQHSMNLPPPSQVPWLRLFPVPPASLLYPIQRAVGPGALPGRLERHRGLSLPPRVLNADHPWGMNPPRLPGPRRDHLRGITPTPPLPRTRPPAPRVLTVAWYPRPLVNSDLSIIPSLPHLHLAQSSARWLRCTAAPPLPLPEMGHYQALSRQSARRRPSLVRRACARQS